MPLHLECVDAARDAYAAITGGRVDLCFLANEPAREEGVAFTAPYVLIEGVYVTDSGSPLRTSGRGRPHRSPHRRARGFGVRPLPRPGRSSTPRSSGAREATDIYEEQGLDVAAGVRQPMEAYVAATGRRILEPAFMEIQQSVGLPRALDPDAVAAVAAEVEELKASASSATSSPAAGWRRQSHHAPDGGAPRPT